MSKIPISFRDAPKELVPMSHEQAMRIVHIYNMFGSGIRCESLEINRDVNTLSENLIDYVVRKIMYRYEQRMLKGVDGMRELADRSVAEVNKIKNRVSRLYGAGRITYEEFQKVNGALISLEDTLKEVKEFDGN